MWRLGLLALVDAEAVRLAGGNTDAGRVEVFHEGRWRWICYDDAFSVKEAEVVCRALGLRRGLGSMRMEGPKDLSQLSTRPRCEGTEKDLLSCELPKAPWQRGEGLWLPGGLPVGGAARGWCALHQLPARGDVF